MDIFIGCTLVGEGIIYVLTLLVIFSYSQKLKHDRPASMTDPFSSEDFIVRFAPFAVTEILKISGGFAQTR